MIWLWLALSAFAASDDELYAAWEKGEYLTAGRLADEALETHPHSLHANFVKGYVLWQEEGEHAAAKHYLDKADGIYWKKHPNNNPEDPWRVHLEVMSARIDVASEMGDPELQLELIDRYNELFQPTLEVERAWPLMRLHRFRQAREAAQGGIDSDDEWQQNSGLNSMCAIESQALFRAAAHRWCYQALVQERSSSFPDVTVDASNAAGSALGILDFDTSLELAREATTGSSNTVTNPYNTLVAHYTRAANGAEAIRAVAALVDWRSRQPASMRDLARSGADETVAHFLYAAGRADRARELIDRVITYPDRAGLTSSDPLQAEGRHAALRLAIRRLQAEAAQEEAATYGLFSRFGHWLGSWLPDAGVWEDRATLRAALTDDRRLRATFRVYLAGGIGLEPWQMMGLPHEVGQGVFLTAVANARDADAVVEEEPPPTLETLPHYYDALDVSAAFVRGDWSEVREKGPSAHAGLPRAEALLRAELAAMLGEAAWRQGDEAKALEWFDAAVNTDPGALRRLGLALPARVSGGGDDVSDAVVTMLGRSPRLRSYDSGFSVGVSGSGADVRICLSDRFGAQLSCSSAGSADEDASDWELARHHVLSWTERAFALPTGASSIDLDSLDGSTLKRGEAVGEAIDAILEGM